jgi:uncharacterized membrane protein
MDRWEVYDVFLVDLLFALVMALLFTMVFAVGFRRPGPWSSVLVFFLVVFLAAWAGGLWVSPAGPVFLGIYWLPILLLSFLVALLLAAVPPRRPPHVKTISEAKEELREERATERAFDTFFWVMLIGFAIVIVLGYVGDLVA